MRRPYLPALLAILAGTALLRLRLLEVPLDRDEGEFAYMGQLILAGEIPYLAAQNMKLPGAYYALAAILSALGESTAAIRTGLLLVNLATIALLARLGRRLLDETAGLTAAASYAILSLSPAVLGFAAKAEHFAAPCIAGGTLLLLEPRPDGETPRVSRRVARVALAGLLFGLAVVVKQHAAAFLVFGAALLVADGVRQPRREMLAMATSLAAFSVASILPYAATCLAMVRAGAFEPFWFWTVTYAREYASMIPVSEGLERLAIEGDRILRSSPALWLLVAVGWSAILWDAATRRAAPVLGLLSLFSAAAVAAGLRFSSHYFILLLPVASLWAGAGASALGRATAARSGAGPAATAVRIAVPAAAIALSLAAERAFLFVLSPEAVARVTYESNPFPEAIEIARHLKEKANPGDRVAVIGSEPEIYFLSGLRAATTFLYTYPLMEPHPFALRMQEDMVAQIERERPRFLVLVNVDTSWSLRPGSHDLILRRTEEIVNSGYDLIGVAEIRPNAPTLYRWGREEANRAEPESQARVLVFESIS